MAIARIAVRTHSRSRGHSVAAAWAYRSGQCFICSRTGEEHDYRPRWGRRADEVQRRVIWPKTFEFTPAVAQDEQALIDAIENAERRKDATILRDVQLALADELPIEELPDLVEEMARKLADDYHTIALYVIHPPEPRGDGRNLHAHILLCTRKLKPEGDGFSKKLRKLDSFSTGPEEIVKIRNTWCAMTNERLESAKSETRIYPGRRLDAPPMPTIPRRYIARAHKRAARRERLAARREGRKAVPIRTRVADLARLGNPANRAMGEIAKHVAAGYDVPESERVYDTTARTRYERAREYDQAKGDASHYASLPVVREELAAANAELDSLERRIEAHRAVRETDFARAEPVTPVVVAPLRASVAPEEDGREPVAVVSAMPVLAPPVLDDGEWAHEPALTPRSELVLEADDEPTSPEPVAVVSAMPVLAPPVLDDGEWAHEPALTPRSELVLEADDEPTSPEPVAVVSAMPVLAPPVLDDGEWAHEPALTPRSELVLEADDEPASPEPVVVVSARPVPAPLVLEDDDEALGPLVDEVERTHIAPERVETEALSRAPTPDAAAAPAERDRTLREVARPRAGAANRAKARDTFHGRGEMADAVATAQVARIKAHVAARKALQDARDKGERVPAEDQRRVYENSRLNLGAALGDETALSLVTNVLEREFYGMYKRWREATPDSPEGRLRADLLAKHNGNERDAWNERAQSLNFEVQPQAQRGARIDDFECEILGADPNSYAVVRTPTEEKASLKLSIRKAFRVSRLGDEFCDFYDAQIAAPAGIRPLTRRGKDEHGRTRYIDRAYLDFDVTVVGMFAHTISQELDGNGNTVAREGRSDTQVEPISDSVARDYASSAIHLRATGESSTAKELVMRDQAFVAAHGLDVPVSAVLGKQNEYNPEEVEGAMRHAKGYKLQAMTESFQGNAAVFNAEALVGQLNRARGEKAFDPVAKYAAEHSGAEYVRTGRDPTPQARVRFRRDNTVSEAVNRPIDIGRFASAGALDRVYLDQRPSRWTIKQLASESGRGGEIGVAPDPELEQRSRLAAPSLKFSLPSAPAPAADKEKGKAKDRGEEPGR